MSKKASANRYKTSESKDVVKLEQLTIYSNLSLIEDRVTTHEYKLLKDSNVDSVTFRSQVSGHLKPVKTPVYSDKVSVILDDGSRISGALCSYDSKMIKLIDSNDRLLILNKWMSIELENNSGHQLLSVPEIGTLRYVSRAIYWYPVYDLFLDLDNVKESNSSLSLSAIITNNSGDVLNIRKCLLMAGNAIMDYPKTENFSQMMMKRSIEDTDSFNSVSSDIANNSIDELISYNLEMFLMDGQTIIKPLLSYSPKRISKKYIIDVNIFNNKNSDDIIESRYSYIISSPLSKTSTNSSEELREQKRNQKGGENNIPLTTDLPAGYLRIYSKTKSDSNVLLASVKINRTSASGRIVAEIGSTTSVRAKFSISDSTDQIEESTNTRKKYTITNYNIEGKIFNDNKAKITCAVRMYVGSGSLIGSSNRISKKSQYIEWPMTIEPGITDVDLSFQLRH